MHPRESQLVVLANRQAAMALKVVRETYVSARPGGEHKPPNQTDFGNYICEKLGMKKRSRQWWQQMETGDLLVPAAMLIAVSADAGMTLEEVLSIALHRMVHGEGKVLLAQQEEGRARRLRDAGRGDRIANLLQRLRTYRGLESRLTDATDSPPIENG